MANLDAYLSSLPPPRNASLPVYLSASPPPPSLAPPPAGVAQQPYVAPGALQLILPRPSPPLIPPNAEATLTASQASVEADASDLQIIKSRESKASFNKTRIYRKKSLPATTSLSLASDGGSRYVPTGPVPDCYVLLTFHASSSGPRLTICPAPPGLRMKPSSVMGGNSALKTVADAERYLQDSMVRTAGLGMGADSKTTAMTRLLGGPDVDEGTMLSKSGRRKGGAVGSGKAGAAVPPSAADDGIFGRGGQARAAVKDLVSDSVYAGDVMQGTMGVTGGGQMVLGGSNDDEFGGDAEFRPGKVGEGGGDYKDGVAESRGGRERGLRVGAGGGGVNEVEANFGGRDMSYIFNDADFDVSAELFDNDDDGQEDHKPFVEEDDFGDEYRGEADMGDLKDLDDKLGGVETVKKEKKRTAYEDDMGDGPKINEDEGRKRRKVQETKDKNGLPIVSQDLIVREMWLRGGSCAMKDMVKAFKISKKTPDRTKKFMELLGKVAQKKGSEVVLKDHFKDGA